MQLVEPICVRRPLTAHDQFEFSNEPRSERDLRNRGIGRGRMFLGTLLLVAAVITWAIGLMMGVHGDVVAKGTEQVSMVAVTFKRNGAIGTLILSGLSAWLLFPARRPKWPARDWALIALLAFLVGSSLYTLFWLYSVLH